MRLLRLAVETGCRLAIDTDAHAPGQLEWQLRGCERAAACGVSAEMVINTMVAERPHRVDEESVTRAASRWEQWAERALRPPRLPAASRRGAS